MAKKKSPSKAPAAQKPGGKKTSPKKPVESRSVVAEIVEDEGPLTVDADEPEGLRQEAEDFEEGDVEPVSDSSRALAIPENKSVTATTDPLAMYLSDIRRYPVLDREQESKLAKTYFESKDPEAAQALVKANLRFVVKIAAEYSKFGARMIDLIQEGNIGLMHAVKEFNPYRGTRLITYAVWWIRGYIQEYLMRQYSMVRIGTTQNQRKLFYQLQKKKDQLDALGANPDYAMIAEKLGIPEDEVQSMAQRLSGRDVSLDRPVGDDSGTRLSDLQKSNDEEAVDDQMARREQIELLKGAIDEVRPTLNDREKILLEERILADDPLTLQEIGEKYGITREAVRQAEARLMKKIKDRLTAE